MRIRFQFKAKDSTVENCPARYVVLDGRRGYLVQGKQLDADTLVQVRELGAANQSPLGDDETVVWVPSDIIERKE
jgi:hypothetical protein